MTVRSCLINILVNIEKLTWINCLEHLRSDLERRGKKMWWFVILFFFNLLIQYLKKRLVKLEKLKSVSQNQFRHLNIQTVYHQLFSSIIFLLILILFLYVLLIVHGVFCGPLFCHRFVLLSVGFVESSNVWDQRIVWVWIGEH